MPNCKWNATGCASISPDFSLASLTLRAQSVRVFELAKATVAAALATDASVLLVTLATGRTLQLRFATPSLAAEWRAALSASAASSLRRVSSSSSLASSIILPLSRSPGSLSASPSPAGAAPQSSLGSSPGPSSALLTVHARLLIDHDMFVSALEPPPPALASPAPQTFLGWRTAQLLGRHVEQLLPTAVARELLAAPSRDAQDRLLHSIFGAYAAAPKRAFLLRSDGQTVAALLSLSSPAGKSVLDINRRGYVLTVYESSDLQAPVDPELLARYVSDQLRALRVSMMTTSGESTARDPIGSVPNTSRDSVVSNDPGSSRSPESESSRSVFSRTRVRSARETREAREMRDASRDGHLQPAVSAPAVVRSARIDVDGSIFDADDPLLSVMEPLAGISPGDPSDPATERRALMRVGWISARLLDFDERMRAQSGGSSGARALAQERAALIAEQSDLLHYLSSTSSTTAGTTSSSSRRKERSHQRHRVRTGSTEAVSAAHAAGEAAAAVAVAAPAPAPAPTPTPTPAPTVAAPTAASTAAVAAESASRVTKRASRRAMQKQKSFGALPETVIEAARSKTGSSRGSGRRRRRPTSTSSATVLKRQDSNSVSSRTQSSLVPINEEAMAIPALILNDPALANARNSTELVMTPVPMQLNRAGGAAVEASGVDFLDIKTSSTSSSPTTKVERDAEARRKASRGVSLPNWLDAQMPGTSARDPAKRKKHSLRVQKGSPSSARPKQPSKAIGQHSFDSPGASTSPSRERQGSSEKSAAGVTLKQRMSSRSSLLPLYRAEMVTSNNLAVRRLTSRVRPNVHRLERFVTALHGAGWHPNVAFTHALVQLQNELWIVMEWCDGSSVCEAMRLLRAPLVEPQLTAVLKHTVGALTHLRAHNIVHGDVKCANIMLTSAGDAKLTNTSLSSMIEAPAHRESVRSANWLAPELLLGGAPSFASDVWALGICIIEMVFRAPPPPLVVHGGAAVPSEPWPDLGVTHSLGLAAMMRACLNPVAESRPHIDVLRRQALLVSLDASTSRRALAALSTRCLRANIALFSGTRSNDTEGASSPHE